MPSPPHGDAKPSPHGRFPNAPRAVRSPSSAIAGRPRRSKRMSVPRAHVRCAPSASRRRAATAWQRALIASKSALISRASRSAVTPGIVAPRAPPSLARLRAVVCDSDGRQGAMKTSAAASAAATVGGGSVPRSGLGGRIIRTASPPAARAACRSASPSAGVAGIGDDEHGLARRHSEAALEDGAHRPIEVLHVRAPISPR